MHLPARRAVPVLAVLAGLLLAALAGGCAREPEIAAWPGDPDSIPSAFARAGAALAWPGAARAFQVRDDGDLYDGAWTFALRPRANGVAASAPRRVAFEQRWRPVAHWRRSGGGVRWDFEACALPAPAPADTVLMVSLAVRATNPGVTAAACTLRVGVEPLPAHAAWVAADAPASGPPPAWKADGHEPGVGTTRDAAEDASGALAVRSLAPGASAAWRFVLASHPLPGGTLKRWAHVDHGSRVAEVRRHWDAEVARGARFELGDPEVEDALRAARVVLLSSRMRIGGAWLPDAGPFQYRDVWLRDGARSVAALAVAGYGREARELADGLAGFQWSQGPFLSQRGQYDGVGQALWAFAQASLRPAADSTTARLAERAWGACAWLEAQRRFGAMTAWPYALLLPYGEPRDAELVRAQLVGNDAWAIAGLASAARLLRAAHRDADAAHADSLGAAWSAAFRAALARSGRADVPPSWQGVGLDWGNLATGWPARALPAGDPRLAALAARTWAACPEPGLASYAKPDSLHGYLGADLGTWALLAGRPGDAARVLDALLLWRDATGAGAELFSRARRDYGADLPPHPMCAAALTALVRNMLVYDDGDTLQLTLGPRAAWWHGARVHGAPTRWGAIDLEFGLDAGAHTARWTWTPVDAWTALALPAGSVLATTPPAPLVGAPGGRVVLAPPRTGSAVVPLAGSRP